MINSKLEKISAGDFITVLVDAPNPRDENETLEFRLYARVVRNERKQRKVVVRLSNHTSSRLFVFTWAGVCLDDVTKGLVTRLAIPSFVGLAEE